MHARTEWTTAGPKKGSWSAARKNVPDIFIHHEGGGRRGVPPDKKAVLRQIENYVANNGYIAIDYNAMVFNDGDVWAGRGLQNEDGATYKNNATSVSICAVGNYELEPAPDALIRGIHQAIREIVASGYSVGNPNIRPHKAVFGTACPGRNLNARMGDIRNWQGGGPAPAPDEIPPEEMMAFIKKPNSTEIAVTNGQTKNIFASPNELAQAQFLAALSGQKIVEPQKVDLAYWNSLPTVG